MAPPLRYYPSLPAVMDVFTGRLPSWIAGSEGLAAAGRYLDRVPVDFSVSAFGIESHLSGERLDLGLSHALSGGRHELLRENVSAMRDALGVTRPESWERVERIAAAIAAAPYDVRGIVDRFCPCADAATVAELGPPELVYFTLKSLPAFFGAEGAVMPRQVLSLCEILAGPEGAGAGAELLARVDRARPARLRLEHVGVSFRGERWRLKFYFAATLGEHLALLGRLAAPAEMNEHIALLATLAPVCGERDVTVLLDLEGGEISRLDLEIAPYVEDPAQVGRVAAALARAPAFTGLVPAGRGAEIARLAEAPLLYRRRPGWIPAAMLLSHLKLTRTRGRAPEWKLYYAFRQNDACRRPGLVLDEP